MNDSDSKRALGVIGEDSDAKSHWSSKEDSDQLKSGVLLCVPTAGHNLVQISCSVKEWGYEQDSSAVKHFLGLFGAQNRNAAM